MTRTLLSGVAAVALVAAAGRRIRRCPRATRGRADRDVDIGCCRAHWQADLLPRPRRQAALFADAPQDAGRQRLPSRTRRGRRQLRFRGSGGAVTDGSGIPAKGRILPETRWAFRTRHRRRRRTPWGSDYIAVYEGEDTDDGSVKLSPGRIQRTGAKSEPVVRRPIRSLIRAPGRYRKPSAASRS